MKPFNQRVIAWQSEHGRHQLPWQQQKTRYRVWVSEIMLQQTQVATVIPYFEKFMQRFPDLAALAVAPQDDVLAHWSGLGYYARARNLHRAAQQVLALGRQDLPATIEALIELPGIGRSTAAAILSLTDNQPLAILDGNVKRVLARHAAVEGWTGSATNQKTLWQIAEQRMPEQGARAYNQGLMDLGSMVCSRSKPRCDDCPVSVDCEALLQQRVAELPTPKPRKDIPKKQAVFAVMFNSQGSVLIERRPPAGIWGGLWCLPQYLDLEALQVDLQQQGLATRSLKPLDSFEHVFSHFKLTLNPYLVEIAEADKKLAIAEESRQFVPLSQLAQLGLPAPIRQLLGKLQSDQPRSLQ